MPGIEDWLSSPLTVVQGLFAEYGKDYVGKVEEYFTERLLTQETLSRVPSLNDTALHNIKANSLVKFRCMIQDMFDPEFYMGVYEVQDTNPGVTCLKSGRYKDIAECLENQEILLESSNNVTCDRQTFYCVPIPGETSWVKEAYSFNNRYKAAPSMSCKPSRSKRSRDDDDDDVAMDTESGIQGGDGENKRVRREHSTEAGSSAPPDLNFPLPGEQGPACLVKVYDRTDKFKLNDVVEFVGVLSVDPALAINHSANGDEQSSFLDPSEAMVDAVEHSVHHPPPSLVPRLHVILAKKLHHNNPLLPVDVNEDSCKTETEALLKEASTLRQHLMFVLESALFGDSLAAEYLICHLVSTVYSRRDVMALGKFSLNLSGCPNSEEFVNLLHKLIESLVTKCHKLPLTISNLNTMKFVPKKDYNANRLVSGVLQVSDNTHLVLDEVAMEPGQLDEKGVKNLTALGNVLNWQKVEYDFDFHRQDFVCNIQGLVLSEGKSLIACDAQVSLKASAPIEGMSERFQGISSYLTDEMLSKIRSYLSIVKLVDYSLPDEIQKAVEEDFVEMRRTDQSMSVESFHALLVLARLLSLSHGHTSLTREVWNRAKELEKERRLRIDESSSNRR